jgi:hypothetical protein
MAPTFSGQVRPRMVDDHGADFPSFGAFEAAN